MITVTERAATGIEEILSAQQAAPGEAIKLVPDGSGGIGLAIAAPAAEDEVVQKGDDPLVIVDGRIAPDLDGAVLDLTVPNASEGRPRFTLERPEGG